MMRLDERDDTRPADRFDYVSDCEPCWFGWAHSLAVHDAKLAEHAEQTADDVDDDERFDGWSALPL